MRGVNAPKKWVRIADMGNNSLPLSVNCLLSRPFRLIFNLVIGGRNVANNGRNSNFLVVISLSRYSVGDQDQAVQALGRKSKCEKAQGLLLWNSVKDYNNYLLLHFSPLVHFRVGIVPGIAGSIGWSAVGENVRARGDGKTRKSRQMCSNDRLAGFGWVYASIGPVPVPLWAHSGAIHQCY